MNLYPFSIITAVALISAPVALAQTPATLSGTAANNAALANAAITVCDSAGVKKSTTTNAQGAYSVDVSGMTAPIVVGAAKDSLQFASLLGTLKGGANTANVNPLTDKIASDVATDDMHLKGTVQLIAACKPSAATTEEIQKSTAELRANIADALGAAGASNVASFDPVSASSAADTAALSKVLAQIRHNREGYSNGSANELGETILYDRDMFEIRATNKLDPALKPWSAYGKRIFIAGDSTASNYNKEELPRMGWGEVFNRMVKPGADVKVVNVAESGRSSRSYITEGWFDWIAQEIKPGDYLLVQFGHNDEKCEKTGSIDWTFRCTYPNDASGTPRFPEGKPDMSFQKSLEKYVKLAKDHGAIPVLITPTSRINQDKAIGKSAGKFPITASTHITTKGDYPGNYSQTVIDTAKANNVAVVDLDAKTMAFMNSKGEPGWKDYHLAVKDFVKYPFYKDPSVTGNYENPDRTHYQENGAVAVAGLVVEGIKADPARLQPLIDVLK
ncbi:MAG TPA: rhamnogalacturonan acetylesterase [Rhodocyclaceae bacterium]|nr:rhamnogalacturonan acetylesterase [Rhodocyclaceae bacterium]